MGKTQTQKSTGLMATLVAITAIISGGVTALAFIMGIFQVPSDRLNFEEFNLETRYDSQAGLFIVMPNGYSGDPKRVFLEVRTQPNSNPTSPYEPTEVDVEILSEFVRDGKRNLRLGELKKTICIELGPKGGCDENIVKSVRVRAEFARGIRSGFVKELEELGLSS